MQSAWLVPLAVLIGLFVGSVATLLLALAARNAVQATSAVEQELPDGIDSVLDALDSPGVVLDPSNTVVRVSAAAAAMGLVNQRMLVHSALADVVDTARRSHEVIVEELSLPRGPFTDAAQLHVQVRAARIGARFVLVLIEDRSDAMRLEDVRRDFVANISHELKTPIGAISLLSEALDSASEDPAQVRRFAERLSTEASRLARITREIIELSRLQARDMLEDPELVEIDHVVASAIDQTAVLAASSDVKIVRGGDKRTRVFGDEALLVVAVHNLIANAVQYSAPGSRVGVGVRRRDGLVEITVTDQGVGIAEEDLERVFERFYRVDPARSRNTGGSGLGLSIVKHVIQNHGGEVRLWSQPGRGSTFTARIPEANDERASALGLETT